MLQSTLISKGPSTILGSCKESYPSTILAAILDHPSAEGPACLAETTVEHSGPEVTPTIASVEMPKPPEVLEQGQVLQSSAKGCAAESVRTISDVACLFARLSGADDEATEIHEAASALLQGKRESRVKIRSLCCASKKADGAKHKDWGVKRRDKLGSERKDADIRTELEERVLIAARKYLSSVVASEHAPKFANADPQQSSGNQDATHQRSSGSNQDVTPQPGNVNRGAAEHASSLERRRLSKAEATMCPILETRKQSQ